MSRRATGNQWRRRRAVLRLYGPVCWLCDGEIDMELTARNPNSLAAFSLDHVVPYSVIRSNAIENLRPAHRFCNENHAVYSGLG